MNRFCLSFVLFLFCLAVSEAQILVKETFTYTTGEQLAGQGTAIDGWAGAWEQISGTERGQIEADSILNAVLSIGSKQPSATLKSDGEQRLERQLAQRIDLSQDPLWISFLSDVQIATSVNNVGKLALIDDSYDSLFRQRIDLGKAYRGQELVNDGVGAYARSTQVRYFSGRWTVMLILPKNAEEVSTYTWVDIDPSLIPDTSEALIKNRVYGISGIDAIQLFTIAEAGMNWRVDDIYFGKNYDDVVPPDWKSVDITPDSFLVASEPFNYELATTLEGKFGGKGFDGPWFKVGGMDFPLVPDRLAYSTSFLTLAPSLFINHNANNSNVRYSRRLARRFQDDGKTYWFGAVMEIDYSTGGNVAQAFLLDVDDFGPSGPGGQLLQIGKSFQNDNFSIGVPGNYVSLNSIPAKGSYFVATRVTTSGDNNPEQIDIWINPDPSTTPVDSEIITTHFLSLNNGWNGIGIKAEGESGIQLKIDDIAVGNKFKDIVPPSLQTSISNLQQNAYEINIYPNPGNGYASLGLKNSEVHINEILVYNQLGSMIRIIENPVLNKPLLLVPTPMTIGIYPIIIKTNRGELEIKYFKH